MIEKIKTFLLALAVIVIGILVFKDSLAPIPVVSASGIVDFDYAYDAESVHEKIDGELVNDAAMEGLTYLVIMRNPYYVENAPNSGEWYIVTLREQEEWRATKK